jgi:hypothetical protein
MKKINSIMGLTVLSFGSAALAAPVNTALTHSVPAVSQPGLILLAFIVGVAGAYLIKKTKQSKA